jgi:hypothetical protein
VSPEYELLNDVSVAGEPGRIHQLCTTFPLLPNTSHLTILQERCQYRSAYGKHQKLAI